MKPPSLFVGLWHRQTATKPDKAVVMRSTCLCFFEDPDVAEDGLFAVEPFPDMHEELGNVPRGPLGVWAIGERDHRCAMT